MESINGGSGGGTTYSYDPDQMMRDVNISDPEELEAHLQVLDVRQRLRQRRRKMIRCFSVLVLLIIVAFLVRMGLTTKTGKENSIMYGGKGIATTGSDTKLPSPPADIASKCSATSISFPQGIKNCEEECEVADCCGVPDGFALSCMAANPLVCPQYQRYCDILQGLAGAVPPLQHGEDVKAAVDLACVGKDDTELEQSSCVDLCQSGFCCFQTDSTCNVDCNAYQNCQTAYTLNAGATANDGTTPLTLTQRIDQLCGEEVEAITAPGQDSCESLCAPSVCCFNQYCVPGPNINCLEYSGCFVLHAELEPVQDDDAPAFDGTPTRASEIHDACFTLGTVTEAADNDRCKTLCAPGACCFEPNLECVNVDCATYAECNILYPSFLSVTRTEVEDACRNHRDVGDGEPTLCEQVCTLEIMQCCFHQNNDDECDSIMQVPGSAFCNNYAACEVLGTSGSDLRDAHENELESVCSNSQTRAKCISLCAAATCCYATTIAEECANVDISITCDEYSACDILYRF